MPTTQTMPKTINRNVSRATRVEKVQRPHRTPSPVLGKSNPRLGSSIPQETRPAKLSTLPSSNQRPMPRPAGSGFSVEKALVWLSFFVAFVLVVLFGVDLALAWPLGRYTLVAEAVFAGCGVVLGYLSWDAYRDLR